jgi:hypothetical protein
MEFDDLLHDEGFEDPPPYEIVNGAMRSTNGTFWMLPDRQFRADGRERLDRERLEMLIDRTEKFLDVVGSGDVVNALAAAKALRTCVDLIEHEMVAIERGHGWRWTDVAQVLGQNASTVHRRFARIETPIRQRRLRPVPDG